MNKPVYQYPTADKTALVQQDSAPESFVEAFVEKGVRSLQSFEMDHVGGGGALFIIGGFIATTVVWVRWGGDINDALEGIAAWIKN